MLTQIENTPDGYIVGAFLRDEQGYGKWLRLRNFGDREGDAIEFREWDLPDFSLNEIKALAKTFKIEKRYKRLGRRRYVTI